MKTLPDSRENMDFDIAIINKDFLEFIGKGTLGKTPIEKLLRGNIFVPKEGWFWDYKSVYSIDKLGIAKTVRSIVSFHNSYGGYLIYGIEEKEKDKLFVPSGVDVSHFNPAQLREEIKNYTGQSIDINHQSIEVRVGNDNFTFLLIHICKRDKRNTPIPFIKNGPEKAPGRCLFNKDDVYMRDLDQCKPVSGNRDWALLYTNRDFPGLLDTNSDSSGEMLEHNLPDQQLICPNFVGRSDHLSHLWYWLSDQFEYTKILAGDGGKGKTSIAYEFCSEFVKTSPYGFDRVLWLSAKKQQFSADENDYFDLQEPGFDSLQSFLAALAENCALDVDDFDSLSRSAIKKEVRSALEVFPSLIVVDDVDSLEEEEQRSIVDTCRQLGKENVRFLITTRKRFAYSQDLCIAVSGFGREEYENYLTSITEKYKLNSIDKAQIDLLHRETDGSPLLTQSILRIVRLGNDLNTTIKEWKAEAGEDARNAAVRTEINSLHENAKRLLLTIHYFGNCSITELRQATGMEKLRLRDSIEELESLFLVEEPRIIEKEARFSISSTTSLVVESIKTDLAFDFSKLKKTVKDMRSGSPSTVKRGNKKKIGLAISQANAFLREDRIGEALETTNNELRHQPINPDLLLMKARILISEKKQDYSEICKILRAAYDRGQRKELLFNLWYVAEENTDDINGMQEVALLALENQSSRNASKWHYKLAKSFVLRSNNRDGITEINDLVEASKNLSLSLNDLTGAEREHGIRESSDLHDLIWGRLKHDDTLSWLTIFDYLVEMIRQGDTRISIINRTHQCLVETRSEADFSGKKISAYNVCARKFVSALNDRTVEDIATRPFNDLIKDVS